MSARLIWICFVGWMSCALPREKSGRSPLVLPEVWSVGPFEIRLLEQRQEGAFLRNAGYSLLTLGALTRVSARGTYTWQLRARDCQRIIRTSKEDGVYGVFMPPVGLIATALGSAIYSLPAEPLTLSCKVQEASLFCQDADHESVDWPWKEEVLFALKECSS